MNHENVAKAWGALWPKGIPSNEYDRALAVALIALDLETPNGGSKSVARRPEELKRSRAGRLNVEQVAHLAGVGRAGVLWNANQGHLKGRKRSAHRSSPWSFAQADVDAWLESRK